eukprot:9824934-Lingulodinium_polyedra.AAC.1
MSNAGPMRIPAARRAPVRPEEPAKSSKQTCSGRGGAILARGRTPAQGASREPAFGGLGAGTDSELLEVAAS